MVATMAISIAGESCSNRELHFTGVAGQQCPDVCPKSCGEEPLVPCGCPDCVQFGYDPAMKQLLSCSSSTERWEYLQDCPGGVSVKCGKSGYDVSCLDNDGKELPLVR